MNEFLVLQILFAQNPQSVSQENLRLSYAKCVLEMRKDAGHLDTELGLDEYQFVSF